MKRCIFILFCALAFTAFASHTFESETLKYKVMYKWGLINKKAGTATITLNNQGDHYRSQLTARSEPWADKFFMVRDTLNGEFSTNGFRPNFYEKIAHEGNEHKHDIVRFSYSGSKVIGTCSRRVVKKGKETVNKNLTLESTDITVDMLSSFYYMRALPFDKWQKGHGHSITIFSGKRKETLTLKYQGVETVKVEDKQYECYHITFIFTGDGGKKTSDDMDAWITTDSQRLAVQLEGKLPVGKVRCIII